MGPSRPAPSPRSLGGCAGLGTSSRGAAWLTLPDRTQVFLKETERQALQETLHQEVVRKILLLQSWFRMVLERRRFLQMKRAAVAIQACWRSYRVWRALERTQAAVYLQAVWRGYRHRKAYRRRRQSIIRLQSLCRGHLQRRRWVRKSWRPGGALTEELPEALPSHLGTWAPRCARVGSTQR